MELAKPVFTGEDEAEKAETRATGAFVLDQILAFLHPIMPFVTEELWAETGKHGPARTNVLALSAWPDLAGLQDAEADAEMTWLIELVSGIRSVRAEMNVPAGARGAAQRDWCQCRHRADPLLTAPRSSGWRVSN